MSTLKILSPEAIESNIGTISTTGAAFQALVHETAVSCLSHIAQHGDTRLATKLMNAMPKGARREGLAVWFQKFSSKKLNFRLDPETHLYVAKLHADRAVSDFKVEDADATPFWEASKEVRPGRTFGIEQLLAELRRKAMGGNNADGTPKVDEPTRKLCAELVAQISTRLLADSGDNTDPLPVNAPAAEPVQPDTLAALAAAVAPVAEEPIRQAA